MRLRRLIGALLLVAAVAPAAARAEEQPAILQAYGLDWIERVRDDAWPQPKAQRPVICLLDTGVDITPDTPADNADGPIVARLALDGGTGTSQGTGYPYDHGTQMASIIAAPRNGWGTVGVFPQGRIVSIRVTDGKDGFITPAGVRKGARVCAQFAAATGVPVRVIAMPESGYEQRIVDVDLWKSAQVFAEETGAVMVAAVGNDADARMVAPLAVSGVVSVSAGDAGGGACDFVSGLDQAGAIRGPGCGGRGWPRGSSAASVAVAALAAALASNAPALTANQLRDLLAAATTRSSDGVLAISGRALAANFALAASPAPASAEPSAGSVSGETSQQTPVRLWRPRIRVVWRRPVLSVRRLDRGTPGHLVLERVGDPSGTLRAKAGRSASFRFDEKPKSVRVWIESSRLGSWRSLAVRSRVP